MCVLVELDDARALPRTVTTFSHLLLEFSNALTLHFDRAFRTMTGFACRPKGDFGSRWVMHAFCGSDAPSIRCGRCSTSANPDAK